MLVIIFLTRNELNSYTLNKTLTVISTKVETSSNHTKIQTTNTKRIFIAREGRSWQSHKSKSDHYFYMLMPKWRPHEYTPKYKLKPQTSNLNNQKTINQTQNYF